MGLLNCEVALPELRGNIWVDCAQIYQVSNMNWYPSSIVDVVQTEEPWSQFCQAINIQGKVCLPQRPNEAQDKELQLESSVPELKMRNILTLSSTPIIKGFCKDVWFQGFLVAGIRPLK